MPSIVDPIVGNWYLFPNQDNPVEVVAIDEDNGVVQVQHFDGDLEEIDLDTWYELDIETSEPPEDWTGPVDDVETDDLGYTDTAAPTPRSGRVRSKKSEEDWDEWEEEVEEEDDWDDSGFDDDR